MTLLRLKTFSELKNLLPNKPLKYITKQYKDIQTFGSTHQYPNVSEDILEQFTPFRRLSKKTCSLSDSKYFIEKFENECKNELPKLWDKMSDENKVDFIVKNRYEKLVSNKIMNTIKDSRVENSFVLSTDGKIKFHGTNNSSTQVKVPQELLKDSITIHNHPLQFVANNTWSYSDLPIVNSINKPFSSADYVIDIANRTKKSYVVDHLGRKYEFIPKQDIVPEGYENLRPFVAMNLEDALDEITHKALSTTDSLKKGLMNAYQGYINKIKQDGHSFKILNLFEQN